MYRIELGTKPYLEPVKKFAVSRDLRIAALVTNSNQILVYNVSSILIFKMIYYSYLNKMVSITLSLFQNRHSDKIKRYSIHKKAIRK